MHDTQLTNTIVMVQPDHFGYNKETALTNAFQNTSHTLGLSETEIQAHALVEFTHMVTTLSYHGLHVFVLESRKDAVTPDAVFPNNWFSHHQGNTLVLYTMLTQNRRSERQLTPLLQLLAHAGIYRPTIIDLTFQEDQSNILEGTGSMVLDRVHHVAFAMESPRTTKQAFYDWCQRMVYEPVFFHSYDNKSMPIYHTNVVMSIGDGFAVYCPETIKDTRERTFFEKKLLDKGRELIPVTLDQIYSFCGNILHVRAGDGKRKIILSQRAYNAFTQVQKKQLTKYGELVPVNIQTIETIGGGSARCMMAEIFPS